MFTPANLSQLFGFYFTFKSGWDCLFLLYKEIYNIMDKDEYLGLPRILFIHQEIFFHSSRVISPSSDASSIHVL